LPTTAERRRALRNFAALRLNSCELNFSFPPPFLFFFFLSNSFSCFFLANLLPPLFYPVSFLNTKHFKKKKQKKKKSVFPHANRKRAEFRGPRTIATMVSGLSITYLRALPWYLMGHRECSLTLAGSCEAVP
jgi:hypothetical protein